MVAGGSTVASVADRASQRPKSVTSQRDFRASDDTSLSAVLAAGPSIQPSRPTFKEIARTDVHSNHSAVDRPILGPPTDWGELIQARDDREAVQVSPDELPVIDIHSL